MLLHLLLHLLLLCLHTSLQQQTPSPGRCDISQRLEVYTSCTSCAAVAASSCPHGLSSSGTTNCSYTVQLGSRELQLDGCRHICVKRYMQPKCCPQHWGPLCLPCPSWSGKTCNFHGTCVDGDLGNGTCVCEDGFSGFACQECKNDNAFGEQCDKECDCEHGVCNKGPEGDGQCLCQPPYTGKRCDKVSNRCNTCTPYSYCKGEGDSADCECLPGYKKTSKDSCASVCSSSDCDVNAMCSKQGTKLSCACNPNYEGDGKICVPRNPCSENNGGCPINSTVCVFKGANKSSCECMFGMSPTCGSPEFGCQLVSACSEDTCHPTAVCQTSLDGHPRCVCEAGQIGDGQRCYGNLLEQIIELDRSGNNRENLTGAVALFERGCSLLLSHNGPFTAFIPLLKTPLTGVNEEAVCKNHLILGQHLYKDLEGRDFTLYGGAKFRSKDNKRFILMDNPSKLYTVIQEDLPAANGIIHIINRPITIMLLHEPPRDETFADKTIHEILNKDAKYNRFLSLVDNCGAPPPLRGPGPLTVFVPTNEAVDKARDGSILYMLNDAKYKLQELLRHHVFSQAVLTVDELAALPQIKTMANQIITISASDDGEILLGEKGIHLVSTNIVASNGIIHMVDGLLYPPSILPILPHRCDTIESKITVGPCVHCSYLSETECPEGSTEMVSHQIGCEYITSPLNPTLSKGCAKYCNTTKQIAKCCTGFYGSDCKPCIGGFRHPCYDRGTCFDGIHGNGSCSCESRFTGVACHICANSSKHGDNCDEECRCVHGVCDNRPGSTGVCRRGTCMEGYFGENCDKRATPCNSDGLLEHCHIHAYCTFRGLNTTCVCRDGYEGDGHSCTPINPCLKRTRGGCDSNAECVYVGPGSVSCVCIEGWTGDGRVCVEINNCQLENRGGCSPNADCNHIGPAQSECVCKKGYMGNGNVCDLINPCLKKNGGCHELAKCEQKDGGAHTCTCPDGYAGDGVTCYGSLLDELDMNPKLYSFYKLIQKYSHSEDLSGNLTVLVPSTEALKSMSSAKELFWTTRHRLPQFLRAHFLPGIYSLEDLERQVGGRLVTLNLPTHWDISNNSGVICIGNASILTDNLPAINGYMHIIDKILAPPLSDLLPEPPTLMAFLNSSSNFTLFRQYLLMYQLSANLSTSDFTLLLPTDDAIRQHLRRTNSSLLDSDVLRYHVIPNELLFPDHLTNGMLKSTLLGSDYQVQFHLNNNNQTAVNEVPLDGGFIETQYGVIIVLPQVLKIQRNRCSNQITLQVNGRCSDCDGPPRCLFNYKPIRSNFPKKMRPNCVYRKRVGSRRKSVHGCAIKCLRFTMDHSCCPGYYGHECFKCPGDVGSWCSNHGECQDGNHGNGECRCYEGFHGTACEDCEPGRYGVNCSAKCVCDNGKCEDGLTGSGKCVCYKGWKGATCSAEIKDDACGGVCDENANCITGPNGSAAACVCVAGYEGNGTYCKELDLCSRSNGGCSEFASCIMVSAGERTCTCKEGYTGDGVVCLEFDGCLVNNGGCHSSAQCVRTGPNTTACMCQFGFQKMGRVCYPVNPCKQNNGGCHRHAHCKDMGNGERNCTCYRGYMGDGIDCIGNTQIELSIKLENSFFYQMMRTADVRSLYGDTAFTVFVPLRETNNQSTIDQWQLFGRLDELVRYHIVSCERLTLSDLKTTERVVSTSGHTLHFSLQQGSVWLNNRSRIVKSDYTTTNGVIHHIDKLLTPYRLQYKPHRKPNVMNFTSAAAFYGYNRFYKLVEDAGLLPVLQMPIHQPFTFFWPTDEALNSLPAERQRWLFSPDHQEQLAATVRAHIVRNSRLMSISQPEKYTKYRTMHGSSIKYSCDKNLVGAIFINDNAAKVVERFLTLKEGVAYGIDQLLEPPGLGAYCDGIENKTKYGACGHCLFPPSCPLKHYDTGSTESCLRSRHRPYHGYSRWSYGLDSPFSLRGCMRVCQFSSWVPKCCKNHYSRDCQVCPGGVEAPCGNHGDCNDGLSGSGVCVCHKGFRGTACEHCAVGHYGPNCTACSCGMQGTCDDGIEGSGQCVCNPGWQGDHCQIDLGSIPKECLQCHIQADCVPDVGCQCKSGFQGNGTFCSPEPPPDLCSEYNGGCHQNADCNQTGLIVNCTCHSSYQGDGYSCEPINRCVEEQNGGCSDFASCKFSGPNERECECLPGYVGNGVQCLEKLVPPVDRCLEDNGGCDPVASCKDLHYHANTAGVFHLRSSEGKYKMNFSQAQAACQAEAATLATFKQLGDAQQLGMHLCTAGWMEEGKVGYPIRFPSVKCGDNHVGLVMYKEPVDQSSKYDAYCYRLKDVSCTCPTGYVGNGDYCNGVLTNVLATYSNFSIFYKLLLDYSGSSSEGKQLVEFLSHRKSDVTLFVPHNAGFAKNQTLSTRDLEYHISANHSRRAFKDLRHEDVITSWLGYNLTVTNGNNESYKLVNKRLLLEWDILAVNGIIHVIEGPLIAPLPPASHDASRGHTQSSGTAVAILVSLLLACVLAALGYYVFKHKADAFRFHYFKNEDEDGATGNKPTLVSIPNPLYNGSRAFAEPFGESSQGVGLAEPEEPPQFLDLDQ
ncbi:Stabilin-1 Fasciclin, EGF-like, laminin-type [Channa argus]|uniref:Stabilin-1 Fasciclin, EGF-like, laminin-type n=1 Tax=Channa argus TaxID=215402 RepID=A0A6G1PJ49_CHAAH|nr:Stabilin-1 Fasciclin, EGF-like, laminin-type [Channa argus]